MVHLAAAAFAAGIWLGLEADERRLLGLAGQNGCWWLALAATALAVRARTRRAAACVALSAFLWGLHRGGPGAPPVPPVRQAALLESFCWAELTGPGRRNCDATGRCQPAWRARVLATAALAHGPWRAAEDVVSLRFDDDLSLATGDVLLVRASLRPFEPARAPGQPAPEARARRHGTSGWAEVHGVPARIARGGGAGGWLDRQRQQLARALERALAPPAAAIAKALALGDGSSLSVQQRDAFGDAGVAHVLAVSGLHVSLVARAFEGALLALCSLGGWGQLLPGPRAAACALPFVWGYAALAGGAVSVLRAALMASAALLGRAAGQGAGHGRAALSWAALALMARDPAALTQASALLSFASVLALMTLPWPQPRRARGAWAFAPLWQGAVAVAATWPITAAFFGRVSWVAPLTNLLAIPLACLLVTPLTLALAAALWAVGPGAASSVLSAALVPSIAALEGLARRAAALPGAAGPSAAWSLPALVAGALAWAWLAWGLLVWREAPGLRPRRSRVARLAAASLALWAVAFACQPGRPGAPAGSLCLWQLDVGQGESTLVHAPDGRWLLFDAGGASHPRGRDPGSEVVVPALRALGVTRLALVVLTHPHPDHLGGLAAVVRAMPVDVLAFNGDGARHAGVRALADHVRRRGGEAGLARPHYAFGALALDLYSADVPVPPAASWRAHERGVNDRSLVALLRLGARRALVTGDIETAREAQLASMVPPVELLQVAHHGSSTSSTWPFLRALSPEMAWISCGVRNRFGHPAADVCRRLHQVGARVRSTARRGTLKACTDGRAWRYEEALSEAVSMRVSPVP